MKKNRQEKLLELISMYDIETQEELIDRLSRCGFQVTQATISRDIRELNISKMTTGRGSYRYAVPKSVSGKGENEIRASIIRSVKKVVKTGNLVVLRTSSGLANAVAVEIENMDWPQIIGCVAGDDTIFIATPGEKESEEICTKMQDFLHA